ncbi:hypothetical protein PAMA_011622 [Pampus argenteus]
MTVMRCFLWSLVLCSLSSRAQARRLKLSRVLEWTTVNALIFDTDRLFVFHPDPAATPITLALSPSPPTSLATSLAQGHWVRQRADALSYDPNQS